MGSTPISGTRIFCIGYNETYERNIMNNLNQTYFPASIVGKGFLVAFDDHICVVSHAYAFDDKKICFTYVYTEDLNTKYTKLVEKDEILKVWISN